ncbi:MAG: UDP-glucose 4-epimerase GalE [Chloroflexi bacterium]|nr:UDP-glucose 4-epimerase GalE [Chloroflexota bacterium]
MNILVSGAAGYVGSIVVEELLRAGDTVIALDNLQQGHRQAVAPGAIFIHGDIGDTTTLEQVLRRWQIEAVMHMAAETVVEFSVTDPARFFRCNVARGLVLLDAMVKHDVSRLVFSSTAAVYGEPESPVIQESHSKTPINSYGESKLMFESMLSWYHHAYGLKYVSLRYFNAAGASQRFGEDHRPETHLIPIVLQVALGRREHIAIFGTDYPTRDGSCVRDYVHVTDIAQAHILALRNLDRLGSRAYNLGNGAGYSVIEVVEAARRVTGAPIPAVTGPRRPGDPATLVASSDLIRAELGWQPACPDLDTIVRTSWEWQKRHPDGYKE